MISAPVEQDVPPVISHAVPQDLYRLLMLRKGGSELLVASERPPFTLPCVEISRWERVAENLIEAVRKRYGISTICLFTPERSETSTHEELPLYQVIETTEGKVAIPSGMNWLPLDSISDQPFADEQDLVTIADILRQIAGFQSGEAIGTFGRPGWIEELFSWVQREIEPYGLRLTGNFHQLNASPTFSLVRLETNAQAVWFKAVGEPNLREFSISIALARLFPGFVPTIIANHPSWHGWLTKEFEGSTLDEAPDAHAWVQAARALAELQIVSVGKTDQLLGAGCRDLRVALLLTLVDPFMEVMSQLMEKQDKNPPAVLGRNHLQALGTNIKDALLAWAQLNIPDTLGHLDLNPGNILCSAGQCVFLDWAEAFVGPPFLTLHYLAEHLTQLQRQERALGVDVLKAYEARWQQILSPEISSAAMELATFLAVFAYAAGTNASRNKTGLHDPKADSYLRSLTRRMYVEMERLQERRALCRN